MKIYGVAILAACYLVGQFIGDWFGRIFEMSGNLGGVGFAMILLILLNDYLNKKNYCYLKLNRVSCFGVVCIFL